MADTSSGPGHSTKSTAASLEDAIERYDKGKEAERQVIKQGLSEYFLFTIEGREDIENNQPKRLVAITDRRRPARGASTS